MSQTMAAAGDAHSAPTVRKLVSLRYISNKSRIARTRFEQIFVDGWSVVEHTGQGHNVGDLVVFFEIDSFIPASDGRIWELHQDFERDVFGQKGYHVRSYSAYGVMSQGMLFGLDEFPEIKKKLEALQERHGKAEGTKKAMELSFEGMLGVTKWVLPIHTVKGTLGVPPDFFPLPGYDRAQNRPSLFDPDKLDMPYYITEKLDGYSMVVYHLSKNSPWNHSLPSMEGVHWAKNGRIGVCNQSADIAEEKGCLYWDIAHEQGLIDKIEHMGMRDVALMGELCGSTVMANSMGFEKGEHRFFAFEIYDIDKQKSLPFEETQAICKRLDIPHVPVLGRVRMRDFARNLEELLLKAEGTGFKGQNREGIVITSVKDGSQTKVISNSWLLEQGM